MNPEVATGFIRSLNIQMLDVKLHQRRMQKWIEGVNGHNTITAV